VRIPLQLQRLFGVVLVLVSCAFAAAMVMRAIGRFLVFLVVDQPEIGAGFLLSTFASTGLAIYVAWQVGQKGLAMLRDKSVSSSE
jgi:hypothetical protein